MFRSRKQAEKIFLKYTLKLQRADEIPCEELLGQDLGEDMV